MNSTADLLLLRWRTAQWLLAIADGRTEQAAALVKAMAVEGLQQADILDEHRLLREQFARRPRRYLAAEINRLWRHLNQLCIRCGQRSRHLDNDYICSACVVAEVPTS